MFKVYTINPDELLSTMAGTKISLYTLTALKPFEVIELGVDCFAKKYLL